MTLGSIGYALLSQDAYHDRVVNKRIEPDGVTCRAGAATVGSMHVVRTTAARTHGSGRHLAMQARA